MARPDIEALVTNVNTGGEWIVVVKITSTHGPFDDHADADRFADAIRGRSVKRPAPLNQPGSTKPDTRKEPGVSDAVLIIECRNDACRQGGNVDPVHNDFGRREWTTSFHVVTGGEGTSYYEADEPAALRCPDCGEEGAVYAY